MEVICQSCEKKLKIPDEKIPEERVFSLRCPACKGKIHVNLNPAQPREKEKAFSAAEWQQDGKPADGAASGLSPFSDEAGYDAAEKPFDFLEEEGFTAMVCENDPESVQRIREVLDIMEYSITVPESTRDALRKMKYHVYDLILVNETFDGSSPNANGILIYLERLNMSIRRNIFVGLITKHYNTRDNMAAFLKSVNITINEKDVTHIDRILKSAINENELFFTVLRESMKKLGKI